MQRKQQHNYLIQLEITILSIVAGSIIVSNAWTFLLSILPGIMLSFCVVWAAILLSHFKRRITYNAMYGKGDLMHGATIPERIYYPSNDDISYG
jgi:ABC-type transport system involved in multi-copper enzyme maturation permease subunit